MTDKQTTMEATGADLTEEQKKKLEKLMEDEEGATRKVEGFWAKAITAMAVALSIFALYSAVVPVTTQILRSVFVAFLLALSFLYYPLSVKHKGRITLLDIALSALGLACIGYMLFDFEDFIYRAVTPERSCAIWRS